MAEIKYLGRNSVKAVLATAKEWDDAVLEAAKQYADEKVGAIPGYSLPKASATVLGGVKVGSGVAVDANGVISVPLADNLKSAKDYTDEQLQKLIGGAPENLDTLKEIADILDNSDDTNIGLIQQMANKANKATTLAGYGIGDAYTKTETDNAIATATEDLAVLKTTVSDHGNILLPLKKTVDELCVKNTDLVEFTEAEIAAIAAEVVA